MNSSDKQFTKTSSTLWSGENRTRHFLIPDGINIRSGDFEIRTVFGESKLVDASQLTLLEVDREEAKQWVKDQLGGVFDELKEGLASRFEETSAANDTSSKEDGNIAANPGLDLLSALSGKASDAMRNDPAELIGGLTNALDDFKTVLQRSQTGSDEDLEEARASMQRLRETFNRHGIKVSDRADGLPDKLAELHASKTAQPPDADTEPDE